MSGSPLRCQSGLMRALRPSFRRKGGIITPTEAGALINLEYHSVHHTLSAIVLASAIPIFARCPKAFRQHSVLSDCRVLPPALAGMGRLTTRR
ncbi:MAG: hypothetical protein GPOALKHO_001182 [Sodalis sp.]|nr:MAG: hypothetical protein GPOALKHO_001182 [Sodalis sp.]